ncbi:16S rRNA (cytosine(1402)-N(4))-methyltransferase RsmH [Thermodesulfovibrionales bacterium]|nr:16S rRNA (cytosine(1402)-N(4))-methyltransferase RsmH [Thermodesulfovibrionales bacterium]MCL0072326.1 16S rRNA (cytosine(1402)-N(4))-methyltransferase RsmH [Thermodesulfovibrionales bacterium]
MNYEQIHIPVLLKETLDILGIKGDGIYVDATVGPGGHSAEILMRIDSGRLVGIDRDQDVLAYARERFGNDRVHLEKGCLSRLKEVLLSLNIREVDGVLFDLGVSMTQLKELKRGFSFLSETRLDMRMDTAQKLTAWDVVNRYPEKDIERVLREYGEEPFARRLAKAIVTHRRKHSSINTCAELANFVARVYGRRGKRHPATRTFQAVRIEVNNEIDELAKGLASALDMLKVGGRLCVISYHSLEDRIVKNFMRDGGREGLLRVLTKKPVAPAYDEIRKNPSSRSAKLRGGEKI